MIAAMATVLDFAPEEWSSGTRMVAIALADRVNSDRQAWPALSDLARRTGLSERQVRRNLRILEDAGVIRCEGQRWVGDNPVSNVWTWLWVLPGGRT